MEFFLDMIPPTATAQMKKVRVADGKPIFYEPPKVRDARETMTVYLMRHRPRKPLQGPVAMHVVWLFPCGRKHKDGEWRITRPDTDNLEKMLKDCMTDVGFWYDDAQVVLEAVEKHWAAKPGIKISVEEI